MYRKVAALALCVISVLAGCNPAQMDATPAVQPDLPPEQIFNGTLSGQPVQLIVRDCEVFFAEPGAGKKVEWTSVLTPEPYPFFTGCMRQSLQADDNGVVAILGRQAFGAGGCCATGGTYRSTDGRNWKKL